MRRKTFYALLLGTSFLSGCGSGKNSVELRGEATFAGKPIALGKIVFMPDTSRGNSRPQGFAAIEQGKFDTTARTGRGCVMGPVIVRIEGYDSAPAGGDALLGKPLFHKPFEQALEISADQGSLEIDVPASQK